jgi:hypothetical protein
MKHILRTIDKGKWISSITKIKDTEDVLIYSIDFHAKYLMFLPGEGSVPEEVYEVMFMKTNDTLYADNYDGFGKIEIVIPDDVNLENTRTYFLTQDGGYSCDIFLIMNKRE